MANIKDITGQRFGRLLVIGLTNHRNVKGETIWLCKCDCGNEKLVRKGNLTHGNVRSCGCLSAECLPPKMITHGDSKTRLYKVWQEMKYRCIREEHKFYPYYGGRGIQVCNEWKNDFVAFRDWALQNGYEPGLEIDREDNDSNYTPENCRWISHAKNLLNTRRKIVVEINGVIKPLLEHGKDYGVSYDRIYNRHKRGMKGTDLIAPVRKMG